VAKPESIMQIEEKLTSIVVNGVNLVYDIFGDPHDPPVLLIMGLGAQMIDWREEFCEKIAGYGYWVIRFDNRDVGKSEKLDRLGFPNLKEIIVKALGGQDITVPYTLEDMAADTFGLLDELGIEKAHVVGASMGGMIAQTMAVQHPERLLSLTSIMSSTNEPDLPIPKPEALALLTSPAPKNREAYIEYSLRNTRILGGSGIEFNEALYREHAGRKFDRGIHPPGFARQLAAVLAAKGRKTDLQKLKLPTLVIHGKEDPLVPVVCGVDTAEAVENSEIILIDGWGHSLPPAIWGTVIEAMVRHFSAAGD
jgi:pimeloyl-ACP methyl ester carboxylesterase